MDEKGVKPPVLVLTGATAVGKSEMIAKLAEKFPIEVIGSDSRQIYKYMPIGTSQPSDEEIKKYRYHLISFTDPSEKYSSGKFVKACKKIIPEILNRGNIPFIVGGTFFYIRSLWDGLLNEPAITPKDIKNVENISSSRLYLELEKLDAITAKRVHFNDIARIKRAILVSRVSKMPFSSFKREGGIYKDYNFFSFELSTCREKIYKKIENRVKKMLNSGWLEEIYQLLSLGYTLKDPGLKTIGYREILEWLKASSLQPVDLKKITMEEKNLLAQNIAQKTRQFAKRQLTWYRNEKRLKRIDFCQAFGYISKVLSNII